MEGMHAIQFMAKELEEAQDNPYLSDVVNAQMKANYLLSIARSMASLENDSPKRGRSSSRETSIHVKRISLHSPKHGSPPTKKCDSLSRMNAHQERSGKSLGREHSNPKIALRRQCHKDLQCNMKSNIAIIF